MILSIKQAPAKITSARFGFETDDLPSFGDGLLVQQSDLAPHFGQGQNGCHGPGCGNSARVFSRWPASVVNVAAMPTSARLRTFGRKCRPRQARARSSMAASMRATSSGVHRIGMQDNARSSRTEPTSMLAARVTPSSSPANKLGAAAADIDDQEFTAERATSRAARREKNMPLLRRRK